MGLPHSRHSCLPTGQKKNTIPIFLQYFFLFFASSFSFYIFLFTVMWTTLRNFCKSRHVMKRDFLSNPHLVLPVEKWCRKHNQIQMYLLLVIIYAQEGDVVVFVKIKNWGRMEWVWRWDFPLFILVLQKAKYMIQKGKQTVNGWLYLYTEKLLKIVNGTKFIGRM